jgi:hypothetical protein
VQRVQEASNDPERAKMRFEDAWNIRNLIAGFRFVYNDPNRRQAMADELIRQEDRRQGARRKRAAARGRKRAIHGPTKDTVDDPPDCEDCDDECVVCMERTARACIVPCGHTVLCDPCAAAVLDSGKGCPLCRAEFSTYMIH